MYISELDASTSEQLVGEAGIELLESRAKQMNEPESEPDRGPAAVSFQWIPARKRAG